MSAKFLKRPHRSDAFLLTCQCCGGSSFAGACRASDHEDANLQGFICLNEGCNTILQELRAPAKTLFLMEETNG